MHAHNLALWDIEGASIKRDSLLEFTRRTICSNYACDREPEETIRYTPFLTITSQWQSFQDNIRLPGQGKITSQELLNCDWYNHSFKDFNDACARELFQSNSMRRTCQKCNDPDFTFHITTTSTSTLPRSLCVRQEAQLQNEAPFPIPTTLQFAKVTYTLTSIVFFRIPTSACGHYVATARLLLNNTMDPRWYTELV